MKIYSYCLTLNEFVSLKQITPRIKKGWVDQIIIVDGGSINYNYFSPLKAEKFN